MKKPPVQGRAVRQRVVAQVKELMASTALASAAVSGVYAESGHGVVCDPLPPPLVCTDPGLADRIFWRAVWKQIGSSFQPEVTASIYRVHGDTLTFGDPSAKNAKVGSISKGPGSITFTLLPRKGASTVELTVKFQCGAVTEEVKQRLTLSGAPIPGAAIPIEPME